MNAHNTLCITALIAIATAGCRTPAYSPSTLPREFRAAAVDPNAGQLMRLSSFAAAAPDSSLLGAGDVLEVTVESGLEEERPEPYAVRVAADGTVDLPAIGAVRVAGLEPFDAGRMIRDASVARDVYRQPSVNVEVRKKAMNRVTVLGAVEQPGVHELAVSASSVVTAIAAAGGLTDEAGSVVELVRQRRSTAYANAPDRSDGVVPVSYEEEQGPVSERINLAQAQRLSPEQHQLSDGDVVMVVPKEKRVIYVSGLVNEPNEFEMPEGRDLHLLDAVAMAGGKSMPIADRVLVVRQNPEGEPVAIRASIRKAKASGEHNLLLSAGDLVTVENSVATTAIHTAKNFVRVTLGVTNNSLGF